MDTEDLACAETDVAANTWTDVEFRLEVELVLWGLPPNVLGDGVVAIRDRQRPAPPQGPPGQSGEEARDKGVMC